MGQRNAVVIAEVCVMGSEVAGRDFSKTFAGVLDELQDYVHTQGLLPRFCRILLLIITNMVAPATVTVRSFHRIFWDSFKPELGHFEIAQRGTGVSLPDESVDILPFWTMAIFKLSASGTTTVPLIDYLCMEALLGHKYRVSKWKRPSEFTRCKIIWPNGVTLVERNWHDIILCKRRTKGSRKKMML